MHTAMAVPSPRTKDELRAVALRARRDFVRGLSDDARSDLQRRLFDRVMPQLAVGNVVAGYYPMRNEIDPTPLLNALAAHGCAIGLPWFADRESPMIFREVPVAGAGPWGVPQPKAAAAVVRPDFVLVPLVAADGRGNRIGHGRGHYDRALAQLREDGPVRTVGLAWDIQMLDVAIPADAWDVPLDAVATPTRWIEGIGR